MKKFIVAMLASMSLAAGSTIAEAANYGLFDFETSFGTGTLISDSFTGSATGFGSIKVKYAAGTGYSSGLYVDYEINNDGSGFYFDEYGTAVGSPAANLTWQIDEPGFVFGTIVNDFATDALRSTNFIPAGSDPTGDLILGDDVAMALMWKNFDVAAGKYREVTFTLSDTALPSGFHLAQFDNYDQTGNIYFSTTFEDKNIDPSAVPEPSTMLLFGAGLAGLGLYGRRRSKK